MSRELIGNAMALMGSAAAIVAVVAAGSQVIKSGNIQNEQLFVSSTVTQLRGSLSNQSDASYATTANVIAGKLVPDTRISGSSIVSPWGNITIAAANVTGSANDGFTIAYPSTAMNARDCKGLVESVAAFANTVTVNATTVKSNGGTLTVTSVDTQCASLTGSITFGFSRFGS